MSATPRSFPSRSEQQRLQLTLGEHWQHAAVTDPLHEILHGEKARILFELAYVLDQPALIIFLRVLEADITLVAVHAVLLSLRQ